MSTAKELYKFLYLYAEITNNTIIVSLVHPTLDGLLQAVLDITEKQLELLQPDLVATLAALLDVIYKGKFELELLEKKLKARKHNQQNHTLDKTITTKLYNDLHDEKVKVQARVHINILKKEGIQLQIKQVIIKVILLIL